MLRVMQTGNLEERVRIFKKKSKRWNTIVVKGDFFIKRPQNYIFIHKIDALIYLSYSIFYISYSYIFFFNNK